MSGANQQNGLQWEYYQNPAEEERKTSDRKRPTRSPNDPPRAYRCNFNGCTRSFERPSTLQVHMLTHTGERPHGCPFCSRRFATHSNLYRHIRACQERPDEVQVDADFIASLTSTNSQSANTSSRGGSRGRGARRSYSQEGSRSPSAPAPTTPVSHHQVMTTVNTPLTHIERGDGGATGSILFCSGSDMNAETSFLPSLSCIEVGLEADTEPILVIDPQLLMITPSESYSNTGANDEGDDEQDEDGDNEDEWEFWKR